MTQSNPGHGACGPTTTHTLHVPVWAVTHVAMWDGLMMVEEVVDHTRYEFTITAWEPHEDEVAA